MRAKMRFSVRSSRKDVWGSVAICAPLCLPWRCRGIHRRPTIPPRNDKCWPRVTAGEVFPNRPGPRGRNSRYFLYN